MVGSVLKDKFICPRCKLIYDSVNDTRLKLQEEDLDSWTVEIRIHCQCGHLLRVMYDYD